jgi:hypothetical protein
MTGNTYLQSLNYAEQEKDVRILVESASHVVMSVALLICGLPSVYSNQLILQSLPPKSAHCVDYGLPDTFNAPSQFGSVRLTCLLYPPP